jgi:hypothetical protein
VCGVASCNLQQQFIIKKKQQRSGADKFMQYNLEVESDLIREIRPIRLDLNLIRSDFLKKSN